MSAGEEVRLLQQLRAGQGRLRTLATYLRSPHLVEEFARMPPALVATSPMVTARPFSLLRVDLPVVGEGHPEDRRTRVNSHSELAEVARNAGFLVSVGQIHRAVTQRLIPRPALILAGQPSSAGDGSTMRGAMGDFLSWCRLREHTTLLHPLRALLWMEGCSISSSDLRTSLTSWLPSAEAIELTEEQRDELSSMALRHAKEARRHLGPYGLTEMDAADTTEHVVLRAIGDDPEVGPELRAVLAKAMGLERASSDSLGGVPPWYSGDSSPEQLSPPSGIAV